LLQPCHSYKSACNDRITNIVLNIVKPTEIQLYRAEFANSSECTLWYQCFLNVTLGVSLFGRWADSERSVPVPGRTVHLSRDRVPRHRHLLQQRTQRRSAQRAPVHQDHGQQINITGARSPLCLSHTHTRYQPMTRHHEVFLLNELKTYFCNHDCYSPNHAAEFEFIRRRV